MSPLSGSVFVNGSPRGDIEVRRGVQVVRVVDVEFLSASDAATRMGTSAGTRGVILIRAA